MATIKYSGTAKASPTPELARFIAEQLASSVVPASATLADLRQTLVGDDLFMSEDGEIMHKQDRTSLLLEVDELIDRNGGDAPLAGLLVS